MRTLFALSFVLLTCACGRDGAQAPDASVPPAAASSTDLAALLACNDAAIGGDALRAANRVDYDIEIEEPSFRATGHYYATRGGEMRIDVYADGARVFSEGRDPSRAWEQPQNAEQREVTGDPADALRHGLEQPGHLWTLADMTRNGHTVVLEGRETIDAVDYHVVELTLADGFQFWYWIHPTSCLIERSRNFRAYHPSIDPQRRWTETVFENYEDFGGIRKARTSRDVDVATGATIGHTRIVKYTASATGEAAASEH